MKIGTFAFVAFCTVKISVAATTSYNQDKSICRRLQVFNSKFNFRTIRPTTV